MRDGGVKERGQGKDGRRKGRREEKVGRGKRKSMAREERKRQETDTVLFQKFTHTEGDEDCFDCKIAHTNLFMNTITLNY